MNQDQYEDAVKDWQKQGMPLNFSYAGEDYTVATPNGEKSPVFVPVNPQKTSIRT